VTAQEFSAIAGFQRVQAHDDQTALAIWRRDPVTVGDSPVATALSQ
jgi:hypothetical protein